jgi:hypothetical protein
MNLITGSICIARRWAGLGVMLPISILGIYSHGLRHSRYGSTISSTLISLTCANILIQHPSWHFGISSDICWPYVDLLHSKVVGSVARCSLLPQLPRPQEQRRFVLIWSCQEREWAVRRGVAPLLGYPFTKEEHVHNEFPCFIILHFLFLEQWTTSRQATDTFCSDHCLA